MRDYHENRSHRQTDRTGVVRYTDRLSLGHVTFDLLQSDDLTQWCAALELFIRRQKCWMFVRPIGIRLIMHK